MPRIQEVAALALALCSLLFGFAAVGPVPLDSLGLAPKELWSALLLVVGGGVLAMALGHRLPPVPLGHGVAIMGPVRTGTVAVAGVIERADERRYVVGRLQGCPCWCW